MAKRRKIEHKSELHKLLDLNPYNEKDKNKVDCDAIIKAIQQNPSCTESEYTFSSNEFSLFTPYFPPRSVQYFPLHQAIMLSARSDAIAALSSPEALKEGTALLVALKFRSSLAVVKVLIEKRQELIMEKLGDQRTALHLALSENASLEVVSLLIDAWPGALQQKDNQGFTPFHSACCEDTPLEIISLLLNMWPDALQQKTKGQSTPLHLACSQDKAPVEMISLLLNMWPDALQQKNNRGFMPLHLACSGEAPLEMISLLVNTYPPALQQKTEYGQTPLHRACRSLFVDEVSLDIVLLLVDRWPEAVIQRNCWPGETPFDCANTNPGASKTIRTLLSHASTVLGNEMSHSTPNEIVSFFIKLSWWKGIRLALDRYPLVVKTMELPTNIMADFLSMAGHHCRLNTMWSIIRNEQDLLAGV